ncbi:MAG: outer membrane beta-barrel protein [Lacunisphaera sp.]
MRSKLSLISASAVLALTAHAAIDVGNGVKLVPNVITSIDFNDNLFLTQNNEEDDTIFRLSPGILISSGDGALNTTTFSYNEEFQFYSSNSDLNTSLSLVDLISRYDDGKMKINIDAWFHEANQATRDLHALATLIKRDLEHASISDEVKWTDKSSVKLGFIYDNTNYKPSAYTDWEYLDVPVQYFYAVLPKLDLSVGLRYRQNNLGVNGIDSNELFYNVGVRGEITPKLTGEVQVGYIQLQPDTGKDQDAFGLRANLAFAVSPKTNLYLDAHNNYGYSAVGDAYRDGGIAGSFDTALNANFKLKGSAFWNNYEYSNSKRSDDYYGGQVSGVYAFNEHAEVKATYTYSKNDSNRSGLSFNDSIISLSATLQY